MCLWGKNSQDLVLAWKMTFQMDVVLTQVRIGSYTTNSNEDIDNNMLLFIKYMHQQSIEISTITWWDKVQILEKANNPSVCDQLNGTQRGVPPESWGHVFTTQVEMFSCVITMRKKLNKFEECYRLNYANDFWVSLQKSCWSPNPQCDICRKGLQRGN